MTASTAYVAAYLVHGLCARCERFCQGAYDQKPEIRARQIQTCSMIVIKVHSLPALCNCKGCLCALCIRPFAACGLTRGWRHDPDAQQRVPQWSASSHSSQYFGVCWVTTGLSADRCKMQYLQESEIDMMQTAYVEH